MAPPRAVGALALLFVAALGANAQPAARSAGLVRARDATPVHASTAQADCAATLPRPGPRRAAQRRAERQRWAQRVGGACGGLARNHELSAMQHARVCPQQV
jgi:hypothetical protein